MHSAQLPGLQSQGMWRVPFDKPVQDVGCVRCHWAGASGPLVLQGRGSQNGGGSLGHVRSGGANRRAAALGDAVGTAGRDVSVLPQTGTC